MNAEIGKRPLMSGALVSVLRDDILSREEGANLGSEADLLQRLRVSRSTLRQAARILEQEQLLRVRRGIRGGYFARRPDESAVAQSAALYLRLRRANLAHLLDISRVLSERAYRLAALADPVAREAERDALKSLRMPSEARGDPKAEVRAFLASGEVIRRAIFRLAGNPFLELFLSITYLFGGRATDTPLFIGRPDRMSQLEALTVRAVEAVLNGEAAVAGALITQNFDLIEEWLRQDSAGIPGQSFLAWRPAGRS